MHPCLIVVQHNMISLASTLAAATSPHCISPNRAACNVLAHALVTTQALAGHANNMWVDTSALHRAPANVWM
jgi:hypothetical protein